MSITNAKLMYSLHSAEKKYEFEQIIDKEINERNKNQGNILLSTFF